MFRKELWKKFQAAVVAAAVVLSPVVMPVTSYAAETETTTQAETTQPATTEQETIAKNDQAVKAEEAVVFVTVNKSANTAGRRYQLTVKSTDAAKYGFTKPEETKNKVTALDAVADVHAVMYGEENVTNKLTVTDQGWVTKIFGKETSANGFMVNNTVPSDDSGMGYLISQAVIKSGDVVNAFLYGDDTTYSDRYLYFDEVKSTLTANKEFSLTVKGTAAWGGTAIGEPNVTVELRDANDDWVQTKTTDLQGNVKFTVKNAGKYTAVITDSTYDYYIPVNAKLTVAEAPKPVHTHKFSAWKTVKKATVFAPAKQQRKCACGKVETRNYGKKLTATIKVNASSVTLKTKQSTSALKVTGLANGDSIKQWKSANTKIVKVAKNGKLTAGTKTGKTYVTVTLKSGKTAKIAVKVQKTTVKTTKLAGVPKKVTLVAGKKYTLKPSKSPITSQEKITYKSANTKIATVDAKGVIKAKKAGTVKVTVKSGKKAAVVTVTVKRK